MADGSLSQPESSQVISSVAEDRVKECLGITHSAARKNYDNGALLLGRSRMPIKLCAVRAGSNCCGSLGRRVTVMDSLSEVGLDQ
jgi:hypothetical protein